MKNLFLLCILFFSKNTFAQLHDNMWLFNQNDSNTFQIDFREPPPTFSLGEKLRMPFTSSSFSDREGNLLCYSNGMQINNRMDELMENGDSLNAGFFENSVYTYLPMYFGAFFLPVPDDSIHCYLLYMGHEIFDSPQSIPLTKLHFALIDMAANGGLGKVIDKEVPLMSGGLQLNFNHAGAVRHANGRDWWIIIPHNMQPQYFRILLTPEGFSEPEMQEIGFKEPTDDPNYYLGINLFSQDGSRYADYDYRTGVQFFDFDRCTGLMSNPSKIDYVWDQTLTNGASGMAFSASGKVFYMTYIENNQRFLAQYDLDADDIPASKIIISECPPSTSQFICSHGKLALAPNYKIYCAALIDTTSFHVIHEPDSIGAVCDFEFGGLEFPMIFPRGTFSYFPNYRLYDVPDSACDTLGIDAPVTAVEEKIKEVSYFSLSPNPVYSELRIRYHQPIKSPVKMFLFSSTGQLIKTWKLSANVNEQVIEISTISSGLYFWKIESDKVILDSGKLIVKK